MEVDDLGRRFHILTVLVLVVVIAGCSAQAKPRYRKITPDQARLLLNRDKSLILLDVRTPDENAEKRIPGSVLIPVDDIKKEAPSKLVDKSATILVYCRSGRRSAIASEALAGMGYTKVFDLGGIDDWPHETESGR